MDHSPVERSENDTLTIAPPADSIPIQFLIVYASYVILIHGQPLCLCPLLKLTA